MSQKDVEHINSLDIKMMLRLQRFAPAGHKYFDKSNPISEYFSSRLAALRSDDPVAYTRASKELGWTG